MQLFHVQTRIRYVRNIVQIFFRFAIIQFLVEFAVTNPIGNKDMKIYASEVFGLSVNFCLHTACPDLSKPHLP